MLAVAADAVADAETESLRWCVCSLLVKSGEWRACRCALQTLLPVLMCRGLDTIVLPMRTVCWQLGCIQVQRRSVATDDATVICE